MCLLCDAEAIMGERFPDFPSEARGSRLEHIEWAWHPADYRIVAIRRRRGLSEIWNLRDEDWERVTIQ